MVVAKGTIIRYSKACKITVKDIRKAIDDAIKNPNSHRKLYSKHEVKPLELHHV